MAHTNNTSENCIEKFIIVRTNGTSISHTFLGVGDIEQNFSCKDINMSFDGNIKASWANSTVNKNPIHNFNHNLV